MKEVALWLAWITLVWVAILTVAVFEIDATNQSQQRTLALSESPIVAARCSLYVESTDAPYDSVTWFDEDSTRGLAWRDGLKIHLYRIPRPEFRWVWSALEVDTTMDRAVITGEVATESGGGVMARFRKLPVTIEAIKMSDPFCVETKEGMMNGKAGDWLITGVAGECYPCDNKIFHQTYEPIEGDFDAHRMFKEK